MGAFQKAMKRLQLSKGLVRTPAVSKLAKHVSVALAFPEKTLGLTRHLDLLTHSEEGEVASPAPSKTAAKNSNLAQERKSSGAWFRSTDLWVMSPTR